MCSGQSSLLERLTPVSLRRFQAILALFEDTKNDRSAFPGVSGAMLKTPRTGVDASTAFTLTFPTISAQAILSCSMTLPEPALGATIRFRQGNILIAPPIYRPMSFTVQWFDKPGSGKIVKEEKRSFEYVGSGWHFQADEVARCVREGKTQSDLWGHEKSLLAMRIFDEVCYTPTVHPGGKQLLILRLNRAF